MAFLYDPSMPDSPQAPPIHTLRPYPPDALPFDGQPNLTKPTPSLSATQPPEPTLEPLSFLSAGGPYRDAFFNLRRANTLTGRDRQTFSIFLMNLRNLETAKFISRLSSDELPVLASLIRVATGRLSKRPEKYIEDCDPEAFAKFMATYPMTDHLSMPPPPPASLPWTAEERIRHEFGEFALEGLPLSAAHRDRACILSGFEGKLYTTYILPFHLFDTMTPRTHVPLYFLALLIGREAVQRVWDLAEFNGDHPRNTLMLEDWFYVGWERGMIELHFDEKLTGEYVMILELQTRFRDVEWPMMCPVDPETGVVEMRIGKTGDKFIVITPDMETLPVPSPGFLKVRAVLMDLMVELDHYQGGTYPKGKKPGSVPAVVLQRVREEARAKEDEETEAAKESEAEGELGETEARWDAEVYDPIEMEELLDQETPIRLQQLNSAGEWEELEPPPPRPRRSSEQELRWMRNDPELVAYMNENFGPRWSYI